MKTFHQKPNMYVSHVQLKVSNLERSIQYYEQIIGFKTLSNENGIAYLTFDGKTSLLSLVEVKIKWFEKIIMKIKKWLKK